MPHEYPLRSRARIKNNEGTNFKHLATQQLTAQHMFQDKAHHIFKVDGNKETIESLLRGPDSAFWKRSLSNEWGRLAQGNKYGVSSTDTIDFISKNEVPQDRKVTYATYVLDYRPLKDEPYILRITVEGNRLVYLDDAGSPAANLMKT